MADMLSIGLQSLLAFQEALMVTSQNMANAETRGYCRREVNLMEASMYNGVYVGDVQRIYDQASADNLRENVSNANFANTIYSLQQQVESLFDNQDTNLSYFINDAFNSLLSLNSDTSSIANRTLYLNGLSMFADRMNSVNGQLQTELNNANSSLQTITKTVNGITAAIANLNVQITALPPNSDGSSLLDQRDNLINELAEYVDCNVMVDEFNEVWISIGNGTQLVSANQSFQLQTARDASNPDFLVLNIIGQGEAVIPVKGMIKGGQIGALLNYRDQTIAGTMKAVGRLALVIADRLNQQNNLGIDYNGLLGADIFNDINSEKLQNLRVSGNLNNTGTEEITVKIDNTEDLTVYDYVLTFTSASEYTLTRKSDGHVLSTGSIGAVPFEISAEGFTATINGGTINPGDSFTLSPTAQAARLMHVQLTGAEGLAMGWPVNAEANAASNIGNGTIEVTNVVDTTNSAFATAHQLNPPITVHFLSPTSFELVDASTNAVIEGPIPYDPATGTDIFPTPGGYDPGYRVHLQGDNIAANDTFEITFNSNGVGDNRNGVKMAELFKKGTLEHGSLSFLDGFNNIANNISIATHESATRNTTAEKLLEQANNRFQQISGVSTPEEAIAMARYQAAYQASAQIIQVAKTVFDAILQLAG